MAELKKRKAKAGTETNGNKKMKNHKKSIRGNRKGDKLQKRRGPRLPSALRKKLDRLNPKLQNSDGEIDSDEGNNDFYEYEEGVAEEESRKNQRFDRVENYEYQLPEDFEDEDVLSEDGDESDGAEGRGNKSDDDADGVEEDGDERHRRMLQAVTGIPSEAFEGRKKKDDIFVSEAYPESEFNPTRDVLSGNSQITIQDLLSPLQGKPGYSRLRKRMQNVGKEFASIQAPLPISEQAKLERQAVYKQSKQEITKWEPIVKRNREAPTLYFDKNVDLGFSTVGAIASTFQPRTEFEKKMALLVSDNKVTEAHKEDGSKLLELNEISVEDYMKERNHIAKMRSFLFHHEIKSKRIKKIKSKTYHRLLKRDRSKAASAEILMDPEAAKEHAKKREVERAKERMTLRHKGFSKWSRRIVERGLNTQDEGTRAALAEQFHQHALLTRKMDTINESTSSDSSSEDEDGESAGSDKDRALLAKAKEKTLKLSEDDHDLPKSGLLSLPFMVRGMKKRKDEAAEEARRAVQEYEQLEDADVARISREGTRSGRMVFGMSKNAVVGSNANYMVDDNNMKMDNFYGDSDSDKDVEANDNTDTGKGNDFEKDAGTSNVPEDSKNHQGSVFKNFDDIIRGPGPNTTYEVSVFAAGEWKKMNSGKKANNDIGRSPNVFEPVLNDENLENGEESDADSEVHNMVDGILSSGPKESYVLPSQAELIRHAFAGDDVVEEFEKDKQEILNEENPEPEKPVLLPGWGQWTHVQQKKGLPSWMVKEHDDAKRRREAALKRRKDARLKHVIISEKLDKKAEKLQTKTLPYPFTSKEVFEGSMRVPIGPEFNPATAIGAITRPEVVKRAGVIIKPIQFEEVNAHARTDDQKGSHKGRGKRRGAGGKIHKK